MSGQTVSTEAARVQLRLQVVIAHPSRKVSRRDPLVPGGVCVADGLIYHPFVQSFPPIFSGVDELTEFSVA